MTYKFNKELYDKASLLKASYRFTDCSYLHLDTDDNYYFVEIEMKDGFEEIDEKTFLNAILSEMVRQHISNQTKDIRELILARAFSSTIIDNNTNKEVQLDNEEFDIDDILVNWFESNE